MVAREVVAAWSASGLSRREFAEKHGLQEQRLYNWERRLAEDTTAGVQFREVTPATVGVDSRLEVVLQNGTLLRIPSSFDTNALARVVEVLGRVGQPC